MRVLIVSSILLACTAADPGTGREQGSTGSDEQGGVPAAAEPEAAVVPTEWVTVQASCGYAFRAPPEVMMQAVGGVDSCVDGWATSNCVYRGDYGGFSSDLREYMEAMQYEETEASIDGRTAKVVTAAADEFLIAAVHFPRVEQEAEGIGLTVWAECQDGSGQENALRVFRTITFGP